MMSMGRTRRRKVVARDRRGEVGIAVAKNPGRRLSRVAPRRFAPACFLFGLRGDGFFYFYASAAAQGYGEGVGYVWGFGWCGEVPGLLDGALHLGFFGVAVACYGLFDPVGGELFDGGIVALSGEEDYTSGVAHHNGGARVIIVSVKHFHRADFGLIFFEEGV
jgi:hypothetical protein